MTFDVAASLAAPMGYDLHITRRASWSDTGRDITADEWRAYIRSDPELRLLSDDSSTFVVWSGGSTAQEPWLDWFDGRIYSKYPDRELLAKMLAIARHFGATVQGDDGETYTHESEHPDPLPVQPPAAAKPPWPLWKLLIVAFLTGCVLLALRLFFFGS